MIEKGRIEMFNMLLRRGTAFIVDALLLALIFFGNFSFIMTSLQASGNNPLSLSGLGMMVALQLFYVWIYFVYIPVKMPGQTIGKKLLKIKVVTLDGNDLTPKQYFQRDFVVKLLLSSLIQGVIVLFNGILLTYQCIRKQELRALHDMLVKTKVVHVK